MTHASDRRDGRTFLVDLRVAQYNGDRGIPAYSQSIVRQICSDHPEHRYVFLWDERRPRPACAEEFERFGVWDTEASLAHGRHGKIDVVFTCCFFLPLHGRGEDYLYPRWLQTHQPHRLGLVYDLIPYLFPKRYLSKPEARAAYMASFRVMRESDRLFAISHATRHDTIRLAGFDPARIQCVYGDIDHRKRTIIERPTGPDTAALARHGIDAPYCVYIGGDDWRKNMEGMVYAFAHFHAAHPDRQLVVICKLSPDLIAHYQKLASSLGIRPGALVFTGYVSDEELVAITKQAEMMAYPSLYEGLGLPVLEAYGCGIPVIGSNCSSIRELVIPELTCDPQTPLSVAKAMGRLLDEPSLRGRSLDFGKTLLGKLGWPQAARAIMSELEPLQKTARGHRFAVVGALPPAQTAIAAHTLANLESDRWLTDFFEANPAPSIAPHAQLRRGNRILPVEVLSTCLRRDDHGTIVFVLGNSRHHAKTLHAAMQTRLGSRQRRLAYLHEANLTSLLKAFLGRDYRNLPGGGCESDEPWIRRALAAIPEIGQGLRFLCDTGCFDGLIVNSDACRRLIHAALGADADRWTIDVAMLPITPDLRGQPEAPAADEPLVIGTYGTGGDTKRLDLVAQAAKLLATHRPVRLVVAGWSVARSCWRAGIDTLPFADVHEAPSDAIMASLMREAHVGVQLRVPTHGESSAAVASLLGMGTPVVVTGEGSFCELPSLLTTGVAADCTPGDLAAAIEATAATRPTASAVRAALAPFSRAAFVERMATILGVGDAANAAPRASA